MEISKHTSQTPIADNITLTGFMGTGKSTVGRLLADMLGREFVDMDALIEKRLAMPISRIFAVNGEAFFRQLERELVLELSARRGLVIAAGGGVVLNPDNLRDIAHSGMVICLTATPETILSRVAGSEDRPLLACDNPAHKVRELLEQRRPAYAAIPFQVATDGLTSEQVARDIAGILKLRPGNEKLVNK